MSENSKIEWCDHTFNPWEGCTKVSAGCANCYAETRNSRWNGGISPNWGKGKPRRRTSAGNWKLPLKWNRKAAEAGIRPRVFCASLADWLDDEVPLGWLVDLLQIIAITPHLDWLLLTKRPENWERRIGLAFADAHVRDDCDEAGQMIWSWRKDGGERIAPQNVWIGASVEDQAAADLRIPKLLEIPAKVRFLSCEPLLGPVNIFHTAIPERVHQNEDGRLNGDIHWVIAGGESGPKARPMNPSWVFSLRDQCETVGCSFLFKQWGEWRGFQGYDVGEVFSFPDNAGVVKVGKKKAGRLLDGREWNEFPKGGQS